MITSAAKLMVLTGEHFACVRIIGRASFNSSVDFKTVLYELRQKGCDYFVLDLSECPLMDSTFLGVLAGFGQKMSAQPQGACGPSIELLNPNSRVAELLENLGVIHLFGVAEGPLKLPDGLQTHDHTPVIPGKEEVTRACLEAHRTLMELNPENQSRFKEVTRFLTEDLGKMQKEKPRPEA